MGMKTWPHIFTRLSLKRLIPIAFIFSIVFSFLLPQTALAADPEVNTDVSTNVTDSSAVIWGQLITFGDYTETYIYLSFDYATEGYYTEHYDYDKDTEEIEWEIEDGVTSFSCLLEGLPNNTTYHYRAKARYGNDFVYGLDAEFTTAMVEPDSVPSIHFLKAYKDIVETDDCLFIIVADIPYTIIPEIPVSRAFIWSLMDVGSEVGWNVGYAMNDNGYNYNIYSLYFEAVDAIDWGNDTDYTLALTGSPEVFESPVPYYDEADSPDYYILADTWADLDKYPDIVTTYNKALAYDLLNQCRFLEQEWQLSLLDEHDTKTSLSANGEKLLRNAIPNVQNMAPSIFWIQASDIDTDKRSWDTSLTDAYKERLLGVDGQPGGGDDSYLIWGLVGIADWINAPFLVVIGAIVIALCVYVIHQSAKRFGTAVPGYVGSILVMICASILIMGWTAVAIIGLFLVLTSGWYMFMRRA